MSLAASFLSFPSLLGRRSRCLVFSAKRKSSICFSCRGCETKSFRAFVTPIAAETTTSFWSFSFLTTFATLWSASSEPRHVPPNLSTFRSSPLGVLRLR
jgi:hypothetical protein